MWVLAKRPDFDLVHAQVKKLCIDSLLDRLLACLLAWLSGWLAGWLIY